VKKTRSWFYLGPVTITILLLSLLLWVVPALSGASLLSNGDLSTDKTVVSPDIANVTSGSRQVTVTLTNSALDVTDSVTAGGTLEPPLITVPALLAGDTFRVFIDTLLGDSVGATIVLAAGVTTDDMLPVVDSAGGAAAASDITITGETGFNAGEISVSELISATSGSIRFVTSETIAVGSTFNINFHTSPQEAALVNVKGDGVGTALPDNFDVVLVEGSTAGSYAGSFQIASSVVIDMGTGIGVLNTPTHEQHDVPQGLQGNKLFSAESHATTAAIGTSDAFVVTVSNPPINEGSLAPSVDTTGVSFVSVADAALGTINVTTDATTSLALGDPVTVTYRGADSFTFNVDFAPIQAGSDIAGSMVIPSNRDAVALPGDVFSVLSVDNATGAVKVAVIIGTGDTASTLASHISVVAVSYTGSETVTIPTGGVGPGNFVVTLSFPPQDADGDAAITGNDIRVITDGTGQVGLGAAVSVNGNDVTFNAGGLIDPGATFTVAYALEVGGDQQNALLPAANPRPIIFVAAGSRAIITSATDSANVDAEADAPEFASPNPANGGASDDIAQTLSIDISDADSGVDTTSIVFTAIDTAAGAATPAFPGVAGQSGITAFDTGDLITTSTFDDLVTASAGLADIDTFLGANFVINATGVTIVNWWVTATDSSGNTTTTDSDSDTAGNQPYTVRIDKQAPTLVGAFAGEHWNDTDDQIEGDRRTGVGTYLPGSADPTQIRVEFSEALDGTAAATDFTVDGANPDSVLWFADSPENVFLVVSALSASATPSVALAGALADPAGNTISAGTATAGDGIAPIATVTLDATRSTGSVVITVSVDEAIRTLEPDVDLFVSDVDDPATAVAAPSGVVVPRSTKVTDTSWQFSLTGLAPGRYSIVVTSEDVARNRGTTGQQKWQDAGSVSIEVDTVLSAPTDATGDITSSPLEGATPSEADPFFIEITWLTEAGEYVGDTDANVALSKAVLDAGTTSERDVLALSSTRDGQRFSIAISAIGLGAHTLTFNGTDALGNTLANDQTLTFTVVEQPSFALSLVPGMNLVSVPGRPVNGDINAVFGGAEDVDLVFTYDPNHALGPWLMAQRVGDVLEGSLTTIDAQHAYWVRATATVTVTVAVPPQGSGEVLPTISVTGGEWNLVPVISLLGIDAIPQGTEVDVDVYLGSTWSVAFTFDRGQWHRIAPAQDKDDDALTLNDAVQIGRGYWVFYTSNSTIVP